jgi:hypothetical protein
MKIAGKEITGPNEEVLVLPRLDGDIVIRAKAVLDMNPFYAMCPEPKAKPRLVAGGWEDNLSDPGYLEQVQNHSKLRFAYIALNSLYEFEWDNIVLDQPGTWTKMEQELLDAGFSPIEVNRIVTCVMSANSLDEDKLERARQSFLRGTADAQAGTSGPDTEPQSTPSGEPAKD